MSDIQNATLQNLAELPTRAWDCTTTEYTSLLIYPSDTIHDSGWNCITIVGCEGNIPKEICCTYADDLSTIFGAKIMAGFSYADVHIDCSPVSKAFHIWSRAVKFKVSEALSSIDITTVPIQKV